MRKICETCKHWRPPGQSRPSGPTSNPDAGWCASKKLVCGWVYGNPNQTPIDGLAHIDLIHKWVTKVETGRYFGCIHWKKEKK